MAANFIETFRYHQISAHHHFDFSTGPWILVFRIGIARAFRHVVGLKSGWKSISSIFPFRVSPVVIISNNYAKNSIHKKIN